MDLSGKNQEMKDSTLVDLLRRGGYTNPTPLQQSVVPQILKGRDLAVEAPPGSGRTAAYALPIVATYGETDPALPHALVVTEDPRRTAKILREFRRFAESTGGDLKALAAVMTAAVEDEVATVSDMETVVERIRSISIPLMTILGNDDFLPGDKSRMAMLVPDGCHFLIQGKDHLTVVPDPKFSMAARAFLSYVNAR